MGAIRRPALALGLFLSTAVILSPAAADETVNYTYDARGRLTGVSRSGTVNDGVAAAYSYDKGDNRTNVTVTADLPAFAINDVSVTEGGTLNFTVTRSGPSGAALSITYATASGTATSGSDFYGGGGTLNFAPGELTKTIGIGTIDDNSVEPAETLYVNLSNASGGATITDGQGVGTINDNDIAPPSFAVNDVTVTEAQAAVFTVSKIGAANSSFSVNFATANGTAAAGTNYQGASGTLTFAAGESTKTVSVQTLNDGQILPAKNFSLNLSAPTGGATLSDGSGVATVNEIGEIILYAGQQMNSADGRFGLAMQTDGNLVIYGPDGAMWWTSTNGGPDRRMVMQADGNLVVYNSANQALWASWTHNNPGATLSLQNDGNLVIRNSAGTPIWSSNSTFVPHAFWVDDASATEGGTVSFVVSRNKATTATYSVNFTTGNGTAIAGSDYNGSSGTLTFAPSEANKTVSVTTIDDSAIEGNETLTLTLSGATNGSTIARSVATGTINDNDFPPPCGSVSYSINDAQNTEGSPLVFTVTKAGSSSSSCTINYATANGTGVAGTNYLAASGTLSFSPAQSTQTVTITTYNVNRPKGSRTMLLNLSSPSGGAAISDSQGVGTMYASGGGTCTTCLQSTQSAPPEGN